MTLQVEFWELAGLVVTCLGIIAGMILQFGKALVGQIEVRLTEKFKTLDDRDKAMSAIQEQRHKDLEASIRQTDRDVQELRRSLPLEYVLRGDYIRDQTVFSSKLDGLARKIDELKDEWRN